MRYAKKCQPQAYSHTQHLQQPDGRVSSQEAAASLSARPPPHPASSQEDLGPWKDSNPREKFSLHPPLASAETEASRAGAEQETGLPCMAEEPFAAGL